MAKQFSTAEDYVNGILARDRLALSRAITLIESTRKDHQAIAREVIAQCLPHTGKGLRVGVTGPPGAGKSTFIDALGTLLVSQGNHVAVLAIDPSSKTSRGSILGDKTRMTNLATHPNAFIRPSPNSGTSGGLATKTREAMILCDAAGFDVVFIETVGVGQSEFDVHSMVDMLLLLLITGAGDDIQGIKRGVMEMADLIIINKADGENKKQADLLRRSLKHVVHMLPSSRIGWEPQVLIVSSLENTGFDDIWNLVLEFVAAMKANNRFDSNRKQQAIAWMYQHIEHELKTAFTEHEYVRSQINQIEDSVASGTTSPTEAAERLLAIFLTR